MTPEYVQMLRDALTAANAGIEQIHDDWLEPESWNSAGCGQAAAHCLNISLAIEDALAAPIPPAALRPMSEAPVNTQLLEALKGIDNFAWSGVTVSWDGENRSSEGEAYLMKLINACRAAIRAAEEGKCSTKD